MRKIALFVLLGGLAMVVSCAGRAMLPGLSEPSPRVATPTLSAKDRLDIYELAIRSLVSDDAADWDRVFVLRKICAGAADGTNPPTECEDAFRPDEQQALVARLADVSSQVAFVESFAEAAIADGGVHPQDAYVMVGPLVGDGSGFRVGASILCGGLCGRGGTLIVRSVGDRWELSSTEPGWIS